MTEATEPVLALTLLGVPVAVRVEDASLRARVGLSYSTSRCPVTAASALGAELVRQESGWRVLVAGREAVESDDPTLALRALHHELLHALMRRATGLFYVHAAVVRLDGRGVVLPGLSGAGKSTLALASLCAGAGYLSDELLAFDPVRGTARAFPRAPKIRDACAAYFPGLASAFSGSGEGRLLPLERLPGAGLVEETRVSVVVVPRWDAGGTEQLESLTPGEALLELAASALNFGTHRQRSLDHLTALARGVRAFRLRWRDPHAALAALRAALGPSEPPAPSRRHAP